MDTKKIGETITNILKNKNTLTILVVLAGIVMIYAVYNNRIKQATELVTVPYAKKEINSRNEIKNEDVATMSVPKSLLDRNKNVITNKAYIIGKYVNYGYTVPQYSLFYSEDILTSVANPGSEFDKLPQGYTAFNLEVDFDSTYGNSIYPGNYIDLYVKFKDKDSDKIIFGRLIKGIKVMSVYDSAGNDVFESSSEARKPKYMFFAVPDDILKLLQNALDIGGTILPIPRNASYSEDERAAEINNKYLQNYINSRAINFN